MKDKYRKFKKWVEQEKIQKNLNKLMVAWIILIAIVSIGLSHRSISSILGLSAEKSPIIILPTPTEIIFQLTPTQIQTDTPTPTAKPVYVDPDPITDCVSSYPNCNGSSIRARRSQCSNITCCQVGNNWSVYSTTEKCTEAQKSTQPQQATVPQATQKTQGNNFYCWNNAYGYSYYTSSGDQCNSDNLKSGNEKSCNDIQKNASNLCISACGDKKTQDDNVCAWAYTGSSPGVEYNIDKYGECLNGPDGVSEHYGTCLGKCTEQYLQGIKQC